MNNQRQGGFLISKIHYLSSRIFAKKLKKYNLDEINPAQGRILFVLWENNGLSIQELTEKTSLGKSTLTSMLDRLEDAGFLHRVPSREDRRKILVELNDKHQILRNGYLTVSDEMIDLFYKGFNDEEINEFELYLKKILGNLSSDSE